MLGQKIGNVARGALQVHDMGEVAPQQQAAGREDVLVVINDQNIAALVRSLQIVSATVRNRTSTVRIRTVG